jgi:hypothetical protein
VVVGSVGEPLRGVIGAAENVPLELPLVYEPLMEVAEFTLPVTVAEPELLGGLPNDEVYSEAVAEKEHAPVMLGITITSPRLSKNAPSPVELITPATPAAPLSVRFQSPTTLYGPPVQVVVDFEELPQPIVIAPRERRQAKDKHRMRLRNIWISPFA